MTCLVTDDCCSCLDSSFFIWMSLCGLCVVYAYFLVPETKGLTLEQVDRMFEETTPRKSSKWVPHSTYAHDLVMSEH